MDDDIHIQIPLVLKSSIVTVVSLLLLWSTLPQSQCQPPPPNYYWMCRNESYNCGTLTNITYPFWGYQRPSFCGADDNLFNLHCHDKETTIQIDSQDFTVKEINNNNYTIKIVRTDLVTDVCSPPFKDTLLSPTRLRYAEGAHNITIFYDCPNRLHGYLFFECGGQGGDGSSDLNRKNNVTFFWDLKQEDVQFLGLENCRQRIQVPTNVDHFADNPNPYYVLRNALDEGFDMKYVVTEECIRCFESKGVCGTNEPEHQQFSCYCPDGSIGAPFCSTGDLNLRRKIIISVGSATFGAIAVFAVFYYLRRRKKNSYAKSYIQSQSFSSAPSLQDTEKGSRYFGVPLFTYTELEEATNYFDSSRELGEGGFGTVYFGKLQDGRNVAVKRLYENNYRRIEQFMNEVKILTGLVHPNLVTLYGCTSRHSRELLLVYEYVPNGTVADHLHGQKAKPGKLPWHIRMNIAVETASALKYLHISEIIHRDVKTNNILLDNHFHVKVADFGLSRLFPNAVTHISTAPQGTPGYVDPEYHECYQLTNKSDVYSFGVVLVELISSLPAVDITRHRHEINLANMAINKIHNQALHELVDPSLGFDSDPKVRKMINAVAELAFQCLQSSKDLRPSMDEVVDTLKDIQSDGKYKSQPVVLDISASAGDDVVLLKDDPPPPSPDSNAVSMSTTPNVSG